MAGPTRPPRVPLPVAVVPTPRVPLPVVMVPTPRVPLPVVVVPTPRAGLHDQLEDILMTQIFDSSPSTQAEMDSLGNDEMVLALPMALAFSVSPHRREVVGGLFRGADLEVILRQAPPRERN